MKLYYLSLLCLFLSLNINFTIAAPTAPVLTPAEDPFYAAPDNIDDYQLGDIIRSRVSPHSLRSIYLKINVKNAWQLLVRSEDSFGNATAIVSTIIEPYNSNSSRLLSYQVAEDSGSPNCGMSYAFQYGASMSTVITQLEMYFIQSALQSGWFVNVPDYEGPKGAFTAGRQAGHAVLDSIRAALNSGNFTGVQEDAQVTAWGYSGGSLASGWAAALQPDYAPELTDSIIGVAVGGFVTNITETVIAQDGKLLAGLIPSGINGLMHEYPELNTYVRSEINPDKLQDFLLGGTYCMLPSLLHFTEHHFFSGDNEYFENGYGVFDDPIVVNILNENTLALHNNTEIPTVPLFIYQGELDDVVPIDNTYRTYNNWCAWGANSIEFSPDLVNGHISEFALGAPAALAWLTDRYEGKPTVKGCQKTERINNLFYPGVTDAMRELYESAYQSVRDLPIGPKNSTVADIDNLKRRSLKREYDI
ncbi:secretory lipase-domain-containing protein [Scheffersomyces coipomensis]|uniref:secretory lipase-domain-containing protein n=1 Tax=Scheffersomyces coipomensis TaxID=1788519 RepID=UPI00315DD084